MAAAIIALAMTAAPAMAFPGSDPDESVRINTPDDPSFDHCESDDEQGAGDGKLDVAAVTREGRAFVWNTSRPACSADAEWWTSRHDERSTGAYGTDTRPPGTARDRKAARKGNTVTLTWTPPGDDWLCGTPARYEVRKGGALVATGTSGAKVSVPGAKGDVFTIAYADDAGNWGLQGTFPAAP